MSSDSSDSAPLSDADTQLLYRFGRDIAQDGVGIIWETMFLSAYGIFFALAVYSIFQKGLKSRTSIAMLCIVISLYASSLTLWALNVTYWFKTTHSLLMKYPGLSLLDTLAQADADVAALGTPMEALFLFNMVVGDTVVIWRAWVLYQKKIWAVAVPCIMLLMSLIFMIIDIVCLTGAGFSSESAIAGDSPVCTHAELIAWAFSLGINLSCTTLIGYMAWNHRKAMRAMNILGNSRRPLTDKLLSILVESGFIYCLFWLTQLILFFQISRDSPVVYLYELFSGMSDQISGMYPTLIIVIVNFHQSIWEEPGTSRNTTNIGSGGTSQWTSSTKVSRRAEPVIRIHVDSAIELDSRKLDV